MSNKTDRELLQAAFDALEEIRSVDTANYWDLIEEIRARLAEPEEEPVAWSSADGYVYRSYTVAKHSNNGKEPLPLYRHPPRPVENDAANLYGYTGPALDQLTAKNQ